MSIVAKVVAVVVIAAALGGGAYAAFHGSNSDAANPTADTSPAPSQSNTSSQQATDTPAKIAATITFTGNGFTPSVTTVHAGDAVQVINKSNQPLDFDSDPHPTHTDEPELNAGSVDPGKSTAFVVTEKGHWGFHDHLNPSLTGTLIVE